MTNLDPLGPAEPAVYPGCVVPCNASRQDIDEDGHREHVSAVQRAHEVSHAEEKDQEGDRPQLDAGAHEHLNRPDGGDDGRVQA